jgi:hypothetical protein
MWTLSSENEYSAFVSTAKGIKKPPFGRFLADSPLRVIRFLFKKDIGF